MILRVRRREQRSLFARNVAKCEWCLTQQGSLSRDRYSIVGGFASNRDHLCKGTGFDLDDQEKVFPPLPNFLG